MDMQTIQAVLIAAAPAITAIIGIIAALVKACKSNKNEATKVIDKFEEVRQEIFNVKEYNELKAQLKVTHEENIKLKKQINELLTKLDKVIRED